VLHHVLNGHVQRVGNLSQEWSRSILDVPLALDSDVPTAKAIILKVATDLAEDEVWGDDVIGPPEVWGVQEFGPHGLAIRVSMPTKPMANWDINRQMRERLQHAFDQAHIRMQGQLVELGGMQRGYPVRNQHLDADGEHPPRPRHRGLVPPEVGPLDQPQHPAAGELDPADGEAEVEELTPPDPDMTTELRIERGREVRPD
jgi:moderate conductance mechanosensitive channel